MLSGSVTLENHPGDARAFYKDLDVCPVDMTRALERATRWPPTRRCIPPTRTARTRPTASSPASTTPHAEHQVTAWARALQSAGAADADVLHLHHLTPLYEAAQRVAPNVPIVGHLHGTELLMLEAIENDPHRWPYGENGRSALRHWARQAAVA